MDVMTPYCCEGRRAPHRNSTWCRNNIGNMYRVSVIFAFLDGNMYRVSVIVYCTFCFYKIDTRVLQLLKDFCTSCLFKCTYETTFESEAIYMAIC